jgi:hypothetical protein
VSECRIETGASVRTRVHRYGKAAKCARPLNLHPLNDFANFSAPKATALTCSEILLYPERDSCAAAGYKQTGRRASQGRQPMSELLAISFIIFGAFAPASLALARLPARFL